jgi:hypothetical protein
MKPAVDEVRVFDMTVDGEATQYARVVGPIDLEGPESDHPDSDVYIWSRFSSTDPHKSSNGGEPEQAAQESEGHGNGEIEIEQPSGRQQTAPAPPEKWSILMAVEGERLVPGGPNLFVEAWALIRTTTRHREFQIYWYDDDVPVVAGSEAVDGPQADAEHAAVS